MIVECAAVREGKFIRNIFLPIEKVGDFADQYDNIGVFKSIMATEEGKSFENSPLIGPFSIDLDLGERAVTDSAFPILRLSALKSIRCISDYLCIPEDSVLVFFSGRKGLHLSVPSAVIGAYPYEYLNMVYRHLAIKIIRNSNINIMDTRIYAKRSLLRIPNSIHEATGFYKVPLSHNELKTMTLTELYEAAEKPRYMRYAVCAPSHQTKLRYAQLMFEWRKQEGLRKKLDEYDSPLKNTPPCINSLLKTDVQIGRRNISLAALVCFLKNRGMEYDLVTSIAEDWNYNHCKPPIRPSEFKATAKSILKGSYNYGCATLSEISECDRENCPLKPGGGN